MQCVLLGRQQASLGNTVIPLVDHDGPGHVRSADIANKASTLLALLPYSPEITPVLLFPGVPSRLSGRVCAGLRKCGGWFPVSIFTSGL